MQLVRIFAVSIALLGLSDQSHAYGGPPTYSVSSGEIMILPPPNEQDRDEWRDASGRTFKSGKWLALACNADKCRLVSVMLKVTNNPFPETQSLNEEQKYFAINSFIPQTMEWDLSAISEYENIVMFVMPHAGLKPGAVQTWPVLKKHDRSGYDSAETGDETVVATASAGKPDRQSIVVPLAITDKGCTEAQADNRECLRTSFRVQLREGKIHQWLGPPTTDPCFPIGSNARLPVNYLIWVGDLDHDQKPDYIIYLGYTDGYILMLSSFAKPGQLVGEAGHYQPGIQCD
jgi:hypothetical protein